MLKIVGLVGIENFILIFGGFSVEFTELLE